jgi:chemotaxis receptor (MCP) glutamine deamidase CheD
MPEAPRELFVRSDEFRLAHEATELLVSELRAALAICVYDDTQPVGGLLHLRYVATDKDQPIDLTDNTLSSNLLLMDRFCKELRSAGARKASWRVSILGHTPDDSPGMEGPAATVLDLAKAYFADGRLPIECKEIRRPLGVMVRFDPHHGRIWVAGTPGTATNSKPAAPLLA